MPDSDDRDAVDVLVEQWRTRLTAENKDMGDLEVMGTVARLFHTTDRVGRAVFALHARFGLEFWEYDVLATLYRAGDPGGLSGKALGRATLRTSGAITNRVDKLAQRGLVERRTDPADRRGMLVELTPEGRRKVEEVTPAHIANEAGILACLSLDERSMLNTLLRKLLIATDDPPLSG
jgi:DNA-binding MarR family transcriptional regulator